MTATTTITPMLCVDDAAGAIEFYKAAFGATEEMRLNDDTGRVSHCEIKIGGVTVMISDEYPEIAVLSPKTVGGSPVMILVDVADVDTLFHQAVAAGATVVRPLQDSFGGALRTAKITDPYGHRWMLTTENQILMQEQLSKMAGEG